MKLFSAISRSEWRIVTLVALAMVVLTAAPYVYGYFSAPTGYAYTGLHAMSPGDIPVYYSYINQVKRGEVFVRDLFTSEPQSSGLFNVWWFLVGSLARLFNLGAALAFQLARLFMVMVAVFGIYAWMSNLFTSPRWRLIALIFALGSAGVGAYFAPWLSALDPKATGPITGFDQGHWPIDLGIGEGSVFNALYQSSHFIASLLLLLVIFSCVVAASESPKYFWQYFFAAGFFALVECNFHPYYAPLIGGTLMVYWLWSCAREQHILWRELAGIVFVGAWVVPAVSYHVWTLITQPVLALRSLQNITLLSEFPYIAMGFGFLLVGGALGCLVLRKQCVSRWWVMNLSWLMVAIVFMFAPTPFQSRYTQGVQLLLSALTVYAFATWWPVLSLRWRIFQNYVLIVVLVIAMFGTTALFQLARDVYYFQTPSIAVKKYIFIPDSVSEIIRWLAQQPAGVVLSAPINGSFVAAYTHHQVFAAHGHETINFFDKLVLLQSAYAGTFSEADLKNFLISNRISFVVVSEREKTLGQHDWSQHSFLRSGFSTDTATVYRVVVE